MSFVYFGLTFTPVLESRDEVTLKPAFCEYAKYTVQKGDRVLGHIRPHEVDTWLDFRGEKPHFNPRFTESDFVVYGYEDPSLCVFQHTFEADGKRYWIYEDDFWQERRSLVTYDPREFEEDVQLFLMENPGWGVEEIDVMVLPKGSYFVYEESGDVVSWPGEEINAFLASKGESFRVDESYHGGGLFGSDDDF